MANDFMKIFSHSRKGQTLVEALVALSILTMGFVGITTLLTKSFQLNRITSNDTQATYLAAEGVELTKSLIDHDVYAGLANHVDGWDASFPLSGWYSGMDYETTSSALLGFSSTLSSTDPLYFNSSTGFYGYNTFNATPTNFIRNILITNSADRNEIDVQSVVKWTSGALTNTIVLEDQFYNWHP